jgi:hypothetical protein
MNGLRGKLLAGSTLSQDKDVGATSSQQCSTLTEKPDRRTFPNNSKHICLPESANRVLREVSAGGPTTRSVRAVQKKLVTQVNGHATRSGTAANGDTIDEKLASTDVGQSEQMFINIDQ